jgi:non-specific protein-tyrosine kinase
LIATLQDRRQTVQASIDTQARDLLSNLTAASAPAGNLEQSVASPAVNESISRSVDQLQTQVNALQSRLELENAKKQELVRARDLAWSSYTTLATKIAETSITEQAQSSLVRLAIPAAVPVAQTSSHPLQNVLLAVVLGLMLGVGTAFGLEFLDRRVRSEEQIAQRLGLQTLSAIPQLPRARKVSHDNGAAPLFALDARAPATEALRVLRHHLLTTATPWQVLAITSATPGEGKSTLAANLAVLLAQAGKQVLLVDADLRRPTLHHLLGIENVRGLTDILNGQAEHWESVAQTTSIPRLRVIASGAPVADSATLFELPTFARWLDQWKAALDVVIVDTPAVLGVADSVIAAHHADVILLVVASGAVSESDVLRARDRLTATGVPILGAVLNRADRSVLTLTFVDYYQTPVVKSGDFSGDGH